VGGETQGEPTLMRVHNHPNYFQNGFFFYARFYGAGLGGPKHWYIPYSLF
jgi:hypothetical protein